MVVVLTYHVPFILGPDKIAFLTIQAIYMEPMAHSGYTRVMIYLGLALTTYDQTPGFRSARHNRVRTMAAPAFLDRSL